MAGYGSVAEREVRPGDGAPVEERQKSSRGRDSDDHGGEKDLGGRRPPKPGRDEETAADFK